MTHAFTLLLEIGCEELPSSFVDAALEAMPGLVRERLASLRITHDEVSSLGTPRRLTLIVREVAAQQSDVDEEVTGPPETAAFKDGKPTRAAETFAQKLGVPIDALAVKEVSGKKPGRYVVGRRKERGRASKELLGPMLADLIGAIRFRKAMRWADYDFAFGRPIQWIVALAGKDTVDFEIAHVKSGRKSRGHRFLAPAQFDVTDASAYVEQLREAHVLVDRKERERTMMSRVEDAARALGGTVSLDPDLVAENASLVEEPHVVAGGFDHAFLELPDAVIRAVARGHQKYFVVEAKGGKLLPHYLAVANTAKNPGNVRRGNDGVMRARLSDGRFFFEEDKKIGLEARHRKLEGLVFHARLGTVQGKTARLEKLAAHIAGIVAPNASAHAARAAHLCKNDLVSLMVGEFPELQGTMGRVYALAAGEPEAVADAVRDHYRPIGSDGEVAQSDVGRIVAIADRIDTLVGGFAVGLQPTGAADPFALRRACIGILRTLMEAPAPYSKLHLGELASVAYGLFEGHKLDTDAAQTVAAVEAFATERLRGLLETKTSQAAAASVLAGYAWVEGRRVAPVNHPAFALAKATALQQTIDEKAPWLEKARTVGKRLSGISKESKPELVARAVFSKPTDAVIAGVIETLDEKTRALATEHAVREALFVMGDLAERIDHVFVETLVNDPADPKTPERLRLLSYGASCMLRIADFTRLS